jgi:hypothetical protein
MSQGQPTSRDPRGVARSWPQWVERIASGKLLNLWRRDADTLAAVGTHERDQFLHAGRCRVACTAVRATDTHAVSGRPKEALCGHRSHFGIQRASAGRFRPKCAMVCCSQSKIPATIGNVSSARRPLTLSPWRTSIPPSHSQLMHVDFAVVDEVETQGRDPRLRLWQRGPDGSEKCLSTPVPLWRFPMSRRSDAVRAGLDGFWPTIGVTAGNMGHAVCVCFI